MLLSCTLQYCHRFVRSTGWFDTPKDITIVMEFCEYGDLGGYLRRRGGRFSEMDAQETTRQIFQALEIMHDLGFTHRDLKPAVCLPYAQECLPLSDSVLTRIS